MKTKHLLQIGGIINEFLPSHEFREIHKVTIDAPPERVFTALKELTTAELSPLVFLLFNIRALPARLLGKQYSGSFQSGPFLEQMHKGGFIPLAEEPGRKVVFGLVGQFWKSTGGIAPNIPDAAAFLAFNDPDFAKVAANLAVSVDKLGCTHCSTETRIHVPEQSTRRKFAFYWRIIAPGSAFIRVLWLRAIKRRTEKA
jgi:hypothetical protein